MKSIFYPALLLVMFNCFFVQQTSAQANTSLSNLSNTAVNTDLLSGADNIWSLGSQGAEWKRLYIGNAIYMGGSKFISFGNNVSQGVTGVGVNALSLNTGGFANTGIGYYSLASNTNGNANAAIGTRSLQLNTTGSSNMAVGYFSLSSNKTGYSNVAIGVRAMNSSVNDHNQVAIGDSALFTTNGGVSNTAIGSKALYANTTGSYNSANGIKALTANTIGFYNTALGAFSLYANTEGVYNTGAGFEALYQNTTGLYNTAFGAATLVFNTTGTRNTAVGLNSLVNNTTGYENTGIGFQAVFDNTSGYYNTGVGEFALYNNFTGFGNTALGSYADVGTDGLTNATAIGWSSVATASNQVMLGNPDITSVLASADYVIFSDGRFKKDVKADVPGLAFIKELRPVTYHYNIHGIHDHIGKTASLSKLVTADGSSSLQSTAVNSVEEAAMSAKERKLYTGFVAQEVESAAKKFNYDFSGIYKPQGEKDLYGLSYSEFVVPIVKGMQEMSDSLDEAKQMISAQASKIDSLESRLQRIEDMLNKGNATGAVLSGDATLAQNAPNPFHGSTTISYSLPTGYTQAEMLISDMNGKLIKTINVSGSGHAVLRVDAGSLSSGVYSYVLYADKKIVGAKQMVVVSR